MTPSAASYPDCGKVGAQVLAVACTSVGELVGTETHHKVRELLKSGSPGIFCWSGSKMGPTHDAGGQPYSEYLSVYIPSAYAVGAARHGLVPPRPYACDASRQEIAGSFMCKERLIHEFKIKDTTFDMDAMLQCQIDIVKEEFRMGKFRNPRVPSSGGKGDNPSPNTPRFGGDADDVLPGELSGSTHQPSLRDSRKIPSIGLRRP